MAGLLCQLCRKGQEQSPHTVGPQESLVAMVAVGFREGAESQVFGDGAAEGLRCDSGSYWDTLSLLKGNMWIRPLQGSV